MLDKKNSLDTTTGINLGFVFFLLLSCLIRKYLIKQQNNHHEINNQKHRANHYSKAAVADSVCAVTDPERN